VQNAATANDMRPWDSEHLRHPVKRQPVRADRSHELMSQHRNRQAEGAWG
jgi:hypothetical protein